MFDDLEMFEDGQERLPKVDCTDKQEKANSERTLYKWMVVQMKDHKKGKLGAKKGKKLEGIPGWAWLPNKDEEASAKAEADKAAAAKAKEAKEITVEVIENCLVDFDKQRGRKTTDRKAQAQMLSDLLPHCKVPARKADVLERLVSAYFDMSPSMAPPHACLCL